jgi:thioredoxin-like negative regulator of GroEL
MTEFRAIITETARTPEADVLFEHIRTGSRLEREAALESLQQQAREEGSLDSRNRAGIGLHLAGLNSEAVRIFDALVQDAPAQDEYRLNLATCYSQTQQIALCRHHLRHLAEHGTTAEMRQLGREQLDGYDRFLADTEQDRKREVSRIRKLRTAIARPKRNPDDFVTLARLLLRRSQLDAKAELRVDANEVLEQGLAFFPRTVELIEVLISSYLHHDPQDRLEATVELLRSVAPDSQVLRILSEQDTEEARRFSANTLNRANDLMQKIFGDDAAIRVAALRDLAGIVATYPDNPQYRLNYAFALMATGQGSGALEQAAILAQHSVGTHKFHFNLGQVFWACGDAAQGRRHLQLALDYAATDEERQDVLDRIKELESGPPHDR